MPTLNLEIDNEEEYKRFIESMTQRFTKFIPDNTPSLVEELGTVYRYKIDNRIDECFETSLDEGIVYQKMIEAKIDECFKNPDPSPDVGVRRTYLLEELMSKTKQPPINWVFQVSLVHKELTLDILIQRINLYLVGYKGKVEKQEKDGMKGKNIETETVQSWILLKGDHFDKLSPEKLNWIQGSKSESGFTEEVRVEQCKDLYKKLKDKLEQTKNQQEEVVKRKDYAEEKLKQLELEGEAGKKRNVSSKENLLDWLPKFFAALEANGKLEKEGAKVKSLKNYFEVEIKKPKKRSRAHNHAVSKLTVMKQKWEKETSDLEKDQEQEIDRLGKQIRSADNLLGWLEKIIIAETARENVDKDGQSKNLRKFLEESLEKLQKKSITAENLIKKLEKIYSRMNLPGTSEHTSVPDELLISWVKELEKGVEMWEKVENELDGEKKSKQQVPDEPEKKSDKEVQEELKTELAAVKKLLQKLEKRFSLEKESEELDMPRIAFDKQLKTETSRLKAVLKKQYSQVLNKDRSDFYQDLKRKADHLKTDMKVLHTDAYSNIVRNKTAKLKLNREALIDAVKHLTTKPFDDDKDSAKHIIILIQMICEATRFKVIADHISDNYTKPDDQTASLSTQMIGLQLKWTEGSSIITLGQYSKREESWWDEAGLPIPEICPKFTVIRSRNEQQLMEE